MTPIGIFNRVVKKWLKKASLRYTDRMMNVDLAKQISTYSLRRGFVHNHFMQMIKSGMPVRYVLLQRKLRWTGQAMLQIYAMQNATEMMALLHQVDSEMRAPRARGVLVWSRARVKRRVPRQDWLSQL